jgi:UDP-N-acetyl-D-mannosaminuronic acid dehydrogenase
MRILVVGLGYVGITLTVALARKGFAVYGYDTNSSTVAGLAAGHPNLYEPGVEEGLRELLGDAIRIGDGPPTEPVGAAIICVSTPIAPGTRAPDLRNLRAAAQTIAATCPPATLVVVRSTVPIGASRQVVLPELQARWGRARLAFCPERTIQGQALRELTELPQVVGGLDTESREAAAALFGQLAPRVVPVSSLEAAEAVKLVNNSHTDLIYSFGNEVALLAERLGLDPLELIRAANVDYPRPDLAKPGFVGGGCLSKDPYILLSSSAAAGHEPWLVGRARGLNEYLPLHVARRFVDLIRATRGSVAGGHTFLLGFAYKGWPPTDDMRGAPVLPMLDVLRAEGLVLRGHDFLVRNEVLTELGVTPCRLEDGFAGADAVLVITDHPEYAKQDLPRLLASMRRPAVLYDSWRLLDEETVRSAGVRYASIGYG